METSIRSADLLLEGTGQAAATDLPTVFHLLASGPQGLSSGEASRRLASEGPNEVQPEQRSFGGIVYEQLQNGINLLLAAAGVLTFVVGSPVDGVIILALLALNVGLSILQEYRAERALAVLRTLLPLQARVLRDGGQITVPARELVRGDVVEVRSGDLVPADLRVIDAQGLEVNQASLTGEALAQPKDAAPVASGPPTAWANILFAGSTVVSGEGRSVVVASGEHTQFGETASLLRGLRAPSDFQVNLTRFGGFLLQFSLFLAAVVFAVNAGLGREIITSLTLALSLMLGMVPEALPAVTATTLALGAARLARKKVLVRRLAAVEDLSVVDTLCVDKTGTLTANRTVVAEVWTEATPGIVLKAAVLCSTYPHHENNVVDAAVVAAAVDAGLSLAEIAPIPRQVRVQFTSEQKRMCVTAELPEGTELICKGAADVILQHCVRSRTQAGDRDLPQRTDIEAQVIRMQQAGERVIAVAVHEQLPDTVDPTASSQKMTLLGLIGLADPPRPGAAMALARAKALQVRVKIVTGDALRRAVALAEQLGLAAPADAIVDAQALRGPEADTLAERGQIFGETVPADKYRLVRRLQSHGAHVGVTGDGVNDAPALRAADVGIALASGSDAAKGAADLVLLEDELGVIVEGIAEGRRLFTNVNRYLLYTMVSNFANVVVIAIASLFLNFLPLLPEQVLLLNVLADLPMLAIITDRVSAEDLATPRRWDVRRLVELTLYLGILNALFAFGLLRYLTGQPPAIIYSAWFLLLGTTALLILVPVRTLRWFWQAPPPSLPITLALAGGLLVTFGLVNTPATRGLFQFAPLSLSFQLGISAYAVLYVLAADVLKRFFVHVVKGNGTATAGPRWDETVRRATALGNP